MAFNSLVQAHGVRWLTMVTTLAASSAPRVAAQSTEPARLRLVATARQLGPVGYRDPLGVISPDGEWLACTSGGSLQLVHTAGVPVTRLARFASITSIVWRPDSRNIVARAIDSTGAVHWMQIDARDGSTREAWSAPFAGTSPESAVDPLGIDQNTGEVTRAAQRVSLASVAGEIEGVEWLSADSVVVLANEGFDRRVIYVVAREGGTARAVHRFTSEQPFSGLGLAPAARWVAYIAPAPDGFFQVVRVPLAGGAPTQVTTDPTNKTQPSVSRRRVDRVHRLLLPDAVLAARSAVTRLLSYSATRLLGWAPAEKPRSREAERPSSTASRANSACLVTLQNAYESAAC